MDYSGSDKLIIVTMYMESISIVCSALVKLYLHDCAAPTQSYFSLSGFDSICQKT